VRIFGKRLDTGDRNVSPQTFDIAARFRRRFRGRLAVGQRGFRGFTRLAMAIIVYGASALVVGVGLIGAARRHLH
jgi:hypothetical protein